MAWTERSLALAAELWREGYSGTYVAKRLDEATGQPFSKSAVICKMFRGGIRQGVSTAAEHERQVREQRERSAAAARRRAANRAATPAAPMASPRSHTPAPARMRPVEHVPARRQVTAPSFLFSAPPPAGGIALTEARSGQCRFIAGEPTADARCCGARTSTGSSWCAAHTRIVFR